MPNGCGDEGKKNGSDFRRMMFDLVERHYGKGRVAVSGHHLLIDVRGRWIEVLMRDTFAIVSGYLTDENGRGVVISSDDRDPLLYLSCVPGLHPGVHRGSDGDYTPCYSFLIYDTDLEDPGFPIRIIDNIWSMTAYSSNIWSRPMTLDVVEEEDPSDRKR